MVVHNYIMQMTFAFLFEHIPSDISSFLSHSSHTCVPKMAVETPPLLVPEFLFLSCLSHSSREQFGISMAMTYPSDIGYVGSWSEQVYTDSYHQMATHIWHPPNAQAWKTCSLHSWGGGTEIDGLFFDKQQVSVLSPFLCHIVQIFHQDFLDAR